MNYPKRVISVAVSLCSELKTKLACLALLRPCPPFHHTKIFTASILESVRFIAEKTSRSKMSSTNPNSDKPTEEKTQHQAGGIVG